MYKNLLLSVLFLFIAVTVSAQENPVVKKDTLINKTKPVIEPIRPQKVDTLKKPAYVNPGKIAGRRAALSSLMLPGLGQIRNGVTVYRLAKVAGLYTGFTLLTISFIDNSKNYTLFYDEILYRRDPKNNGEPSEDFPYKNMDEQGLITAKDLFRRNKEVIIFSYVGLYLLNVVEAYIDARLKYFNVDDIGMKLSPGLISTEHMYGYNNVTPGIKLTVRF
ncbi:DUF5683 domain-containing protein [Pedobacter sp. B4-66]|uniref:DUF5683 domain-containing protein n=1 Tax=Pedobacter sp. B4-66 TaxID=2817280 RepID=UPI001BD9AE99|nr:DUF5683 domain-containing protein [Pedobacter sp. B4-66]